MASNEQTDTRHSDLTNASLHGAGNDAMPSTLRKFKSTAPLNYKSPKPVRVPDPPRSNKED